jgi:hypothetical protein
VEDARRKIGVPQGSILGPLLFYIVCYCEGDRENIASQISLVNDELKEVSNWFKANKLSVNASKTNYMILGTPHMTSIKVQKELSVTLDNILLERVKHTKFLGVLIDECLTWKCHIDCVSKTLSRNIGIMNKLKHFIPDCILYLHTLYCSLILPYLNYGILIWGNTCKTYLDKLIQLQKWAIRTVSNSHYRSHSAPLFAKYNVLTFKDMYSLELGVFMYKYSMSELPAAFNYYFTKRSDIHGYQTRHINDLNLTNNKKTFSDHAIRTSGPHSLEFFRKNT